MKIKIAFTLLTFALAPSYAAAFCSGSDHAQSAMNCGDGKVLDAETKSYVPVSG
jgi:hypothetical protein